MELNRSKSNQLKSTHQPHQRHSIAEGMARTGSTYTHVQLTTNYLHKIDVYVYI